MQLLDANRLLNAGLALLCLIYVLRSLRNWKHRSPGNRFYWSGVLVLIASTGYGSFESARLHLNGGPSAGVRTVFATIALIYLLFGLISWSRGHWKANERAGESPPEEDTDA